MQTKALKLLLIMIKGDTNVENSLSDILTNAALFIDIEILKLLDFHSKC